MIKNKLNFLKAFSLLVAIFLWVYVLSSADVTVQKNVKIKINAKKGQAIVSDYPDLISVELRGPRAFIHKTISKEDTINVDLETLEPNDKNNYRINIKNHLFALPLGIEILKITPETIDLNTNSEIAQNVPIQLTYQNEINPDLKLEIKKIIPTKVKIKGAKQLLDKIEQVATLPIDLSKLANNTEVSIGLEDLGKRITLANDQIVKVEYKLIPKRANLELSNQKVLFLSDKLISSVSHKTVSLKLLAINGTGQEIDSNQIRIVADLTGLAAGKHQVSLTTELPDGLELLEIIPQKINVTLR